ncbi:hypothetical protein N7478_011916 [Penicillium angulare]|uniref:uncharacterized protein n=1 Tax=Penicillium angulare TaxID=116970 RepID=UPI002541B159|nr:uncharacterized protein N7478_011916 [Penicillium angulare]KAJ5261321.1 hypothetical protein N7478_011916 [Penicillium angulare]
MHFFRPIDHAANEGHHGIEDYILQILYDRLDLEYPHPSQNPVPKEHLYLMLRSAATIGEEDRVESLLNEDGVDIYLQHPRGYDTVLVAAIKLAPCPLSMARLLLKRGADPVLKGLAPRQNGIADSCAALNAVQVALQRDESYSLLQLLLEYNLKEPDVVAGLLMAASPSKIAEV